MTRGEAIRVGRLLGVVLLMHVLLVLAAINWGTW